MEHNQIDTICAISTPPGSGGIAVIRVSGPEAINIADRLWRGKPLTDTPSHKATLGDIVNPADGEVIDTCLATVFHAPRSFTGHNTVEFSVHGSPYIQQQLLNSLIDAGATLARPGEFTRQAFANGRLDLAEAEAVADVIASTTRAAHRIAASQMRGDFSRHLAELRTCLLDIAALLELELDFSDQQVEFASRDHIIELATEINREVNRLADTFATGNALRNGIPVAIVGDTNAGKSTLLNRLLNHDRAIVSDIKGTTRDTIEDTITLSGTLFRFIDTAGIRVTDDPIENLGIDRSITALSNSTVALWVIDATDPQSVTMPAENILSTLTPATHLIAVINKTDLPAHPELEATLASTLPEGTPVIRLSAAGTTDLTPLTQAIISASGIADISADAITITNARHYQALTNAAQSTARLIDGLRQGISADFVAQDLRETIHHLCEITGTVTTPDILATIFSRFCIGK